MAKTGTSETHIAWEQALLEYQNLERAFEAEAATDVATEKAAWAFHHMEEAKEHLLSLWAPDLRAVHCKLLVIWGPGALTLDDPEAKAMRRVLGDICRLEYEALGGSVDDYTSGRAFDELEEHKRSLDSE